MNRAFLAKRMQELGLDIPALAKLSGISAQTLQKVLRGYEPEFPRVVALAKVLQCEVDDLLIKTEAVG